MDDKSLRSAYNLIKEGAAIPNIEHNRVPKIRRDERFEHVKAKRARANRKAGLTLPFVSGPISFFGIDKGDMYLSQYRSVVVGKLWQRSRTAVDWTIASYRKLKYKTIAHSIWHKLDFNLSFLQTRHGRAPDEHYEEPGIIETRLDEKSKTLKTLLFYTIQHPYKDRALAVHALKLGRKTNTGPIHDSFSEAKKDAPIIGVDEVIDYYLENVPLKYRTKYLKNLKSGSARGGRGKSRMQPEDDGWVIDDSEASSDGWIESRREQDDDWTLDEMLDDEY